MKPITKQKWFAWAALLLLSPTAYFIGANILKEVFGEAGPYNAIKPFLQQAGIRGSFGWNINLLILIGPVMALVLTIFQVLAAAFSTSLFLYLADKNCNSQNL
jgi:hypothetical protein